MKKLIRSGLVLSLLVAFSCTKSDVTSNLYVPSEADVTSNATLEELQQGYDLYVANCNSCHVLYSPDSYSPKEWSNILTSMAPRTRMNSNEVDLVKKYLTRGQN